MAHGRIYWHKDEVNRLVEWWEMHGTDKPFEFHEFAEYVGEVLEDEKSAGSHVFDHAPTYTQDAKGYTVHYSGLVVKHEPSAVQTTQADSSSEPEEAKPLSGWRRKKSSDDGANPS